MLFWHLVGGEGGSSRPAHVVRLIPLTYHPTTITRVSEPSSNKTRNPFPAVLGAIGTSLSADRWSKTRTVSHRADVQNGLASFESEASGEATLDARLMDFWSQPDANGLTVHVSTTGDDDWGTGSQTAPLRTPHGAQVSTRTCNINRFTG